MIAVEVKVPAEMTWVKVNVDYRGFYRVNYEVDMWNELGKLCASQVNWLRTVVGEIFDPLHENNEVQSISS